MRFIDHPNVIHLHEVYESTKYVHLLLPFLKGGELFKSIKARGLYKESDAAPVMKNFLSALAYLHENLIVHRDLKPENLLLASTGDTTDVKIADFGLATRLAYPGEKLKLRCGSPGYVSPELLRDEGYSLPSDIFSAGVIFYVMLTGRPLFKGCNQNSILLQNKDCEYEFDERYWSHISPEAEDLVNQMLDINQDKRITAKQALAHPWFSKDFDALNKSQSFEKIEEQKQEFLANQYEFEIQRRIVQ